MSLNRKEAYKEKMYEEYKNMCRALCRMVSYHEKLTTDGFELDSTDKEYINNIISKVDKHAIKRLLRWKERIEENENN